MAAGTLLIGAAAALADPGDPPPPPPPPPTTGATGSGATSSGSTTQSDSGRPADTKPPARARAAHVSAAKPGQIVLTWTLVRPADIAHVFVLRGPAARCPTSPIQASATRIGSLDPRTREVDTTEHDTKRYCYAIFTLDAAGNWASPVTHLARNKGDQTPPAAVKGLTAAFGQGGAVRLAWTNPPDAAHDLVVRRAGSSCPHFPTDGTRVGTHRLRESEVDSSVPTPGPYCYAVFAYDAVGNVSPIVTTAVEPSSTSTVTQTGQSPPPPSQPGSSGSSLPDLVGIVGGGAIVLAGLAYVTLRLARREWEWHTRTGYGIRDLVSIEVRDYDRLALIIPAIIGVCIAGAVVVLVFSL